MRRADLYAYILESAIVQRWHFFGYHFAFHARGEFNRFAESIVQACLDCDKAIPGFAVATIDRLAAVHGRERWSPHFEQLMQQLAELLIVRHLLTFEWPSPVAFEYEPGTGSMKRPELVIDLPDQRLVVEVKCPSLIAHRRSRMRSQTQVVVRDLIGFDAVKGEGWSLPRDNPIKDFLASADDKFSRFVEDDRKLQTVLVIVWDQHTHEVIGPLIHPLMGLLTDNSFLKDEDDGPRRFQNVDCVVVTGHLAQISYRSGLDFDTSGVDALAYGSQDDFNYNVQMVRVPYGRPVGDLVLEAFQIPPYEHEEPVDMIQWISQVDNPRLLEEE